MTRPYIQSLHVKNYGCIKDADCILRPLHALIGPKDTGKSTVLRALKVVASLAAGGCLRRSSGSADAEVRASSMRFSTRSAPAVGTCAKPWSGRTSSSFG
jgi:AAA15 family ATPase/GTPase